MIIIRTDIGQKVVDAAKEMNLIEITNDKPDLSEMKKFLTKKRRKNFLNLLGNDLVSAKYLKLSVDEIKDHLQE